jgi:hypothetical protein
MSKTEGIDKTIELLNGMLAKEEAVKMQLAITDRILRAQALKLKHSDDGKGGKFTAPEQQGTDENGN